MKQALISVYDKSELLPLVHLLVKQKYQILSTGGTFNYLKEKGIEVIEVSSITNFPEILEGRVKTLHPAIHGGILADRKKPEHLQKIQELGIQTIDFVIVNLYPFSEKMNSNLSYEEMIEFIDIGGPSMLRSAAKNHASVTVLCDKKEYGFVIEELEANGETTLKTRKRLASNVFQHTSHYDSLIASYLSEEEFPVLFSQSYEKIMDLRYGENPQQKASFYKNSNSKGWATDFKQLQGKELSYNNIQDIQVAYSVVNEFDTMCCCAVKHGTPCAVALGKTDEEAYQKVFDGDSISIFGGIVAFNGTVDAACATKMNDTFLEIVLAPKFTKEALEILSKKKSLRVIEIKMNLLEEKMVKSVFGGILVQQNNLPHQEETQIVTKKQPTKEELNEALFAQKVVKHVKSNAIVISKNFQTLGIGTGQTNRIWAAKHAIEQARNIDNQELILASDAFFPFSDIVELCAKNTIKTIIQPGGSIRDKDSIEACDAHGLVMIFTNRRHFFH